MSQQPGENQGGGSNSLSGIISTLVPVAVVAGVSVAVFLLLRNKFFKVYHPRTSEKIVDEEKLRTPDTKGGFFSSITNFKTLPDDFVLRHNSLDGYLFLRFFKLLIVICFVGCCITWPVLFPVNATGGGGQQQLDMLTFSNVVNVNRFYAHALVSWVFLGFVVFAISRERMYFIGLRQAYFLSSVRAERLTSRTVLFMGIPKESQTVAALKKIMGADVRNVWLTTDTKDLDEKVKDRTKAATKLEGAQVKQSKNANKDYRKADKSAESRPRDARQWLENQKPITHRLKPLIGKKVQTISWGQPEVARLNKEIASEQAQHRKGETKILSSAFVEFKNQAAAQRALQLSEKSLKKSWQPRYIDVQPDEVIWKNMDVSWASRKSKMAVATTLVTLLIIFWTPIIAFVGALTNINYLTNLVPFLSFINDIPDVILGVVTGLLPTIILAVCVMLVPIIMRLFAKMAGEPTLSAVELKTQSWYFAFQVIQVFLITTFTSGASAVTTQIIQNPGIAPTLLAENLPKASNFYISYMILFGLAQAASQLLMIVPLLLFIILGKFLDSTPRKMYNRWLALAGIGWGSEFPKWTNLGVILLSYSCIAPLILGFGTLGFLFLYCTFRYKWLFVIGNKIDMKGAAYAKALRQLMTGVYLSIVCLIGLFAINTSKNAAGAGPLALMVVFLVAVVVSHVFIDMALKPLEAALPLDLLPEDGHDYSIVGENVPQDANMEGAVMENDVKLNKEVEAGGAAAATGNKLTHRLRPYIDTKFFQPNKKMQFELPDVNYRMDTAYYHPSIIAQEPFIWLAQDEAGVSKIHVEDNRAAGLDSSDDFAWFDEKTKLHINTDRTEVITDMLERRKVQEQEI